MSEPLFMEPVKGSQILLFNKGKYYESLAYVHGDRLYARHGTAFLALRPAKTAASGAYVSDSNYIVETLRLPENLHAVTQAGFLALPGA